MQRFSTFLKRVALGTILFGLLVVGALAVVGWLSYVSHNQANAFREGWDLIHETKDELLLSQSPGEEGDWRAVERNIESLVLLMEGLPELDIALEPERTLEVRGAPEDVILTEYSRLQEIEEVFQRRFFETQEAQGRMLAATFTLQVLLVAGILTAFAYFRRYDTDYRTAVTEAFGRLRDIVGFQSDPRPMPRPRWQEEAETLETIEVVANQILTDRQVSEIRSTATLEHLIEDLYGTISRSVPCDRVAMAFMDPLRNVTAESAYTVMDAVYLDPGFTEPMSHTSLGRVAESGAPRIINDLEYHYEHVHSSTPTKRILQEGLRASITVPLFVDGECVGFMFASSRDTGVYNETHAEFLAHITRLLKDKLYTSYKAQQVISKTAEGFVTLTREKDNETSNHIVRMSRYSYLIAKQLFSNGHKLTPRFMREILWFSPLHDIGKIGISDAVLTKTGSLTAHEWEQMKQHVAIGETVIDSMNQGLRDTMEYGMLDTARDIVAHHHERWDGQGYPRRLSGTEISQAGRIVAVADVFDALTSPRPYKPAYELEYSLDIMREERSAHFDPDTLDAFFEALPAIDSVRRSFSDEAV